MRDGKTRLEKFKCFLEMNIDLECLVLKISIDHNQFLMQWMDLDCSQENHGVPHYTVCEKIIEA